MPPLARVLSRGAAVAVIAVLAAIVVPSADGGSVLEPASGTTGHRITFPIHASRADDVHWSDTWGAARSGGRSHLGVDMLGDKMIPLVAVRSGTVTWGRFDNARGSILRIRDDDGWEYQYIHLNNDTPGTDDGAAACTQVFSERLCATVSGGRLDRGTRVTEGEVIGYLGDGGNAEWIAPHLHFEVYRPVGDDVEPVNPTPFVDEARERLGTPVESPPEAAPGAAGFADHLWYQVDGRYPTGSERAAFHAAVDAEGLWAAISDRVDDDSTAAVVDRLYHAFFLRYPDVEGARYWIRTHGQGHSATEIAEWFAQSDEFESRYGGRGFDAFLDQLYADVLGRAPDGEGKAYWLERLDAGDVSRGSIVVYFTESDEMRHLTGTRSEIVALSLLRDGTVPSDADVAAWEALRRTTTLETATETWFGS